MCEVKSENEMSVCMNLIPCTVKTLLLSVKRFGYGNKTGVSELSSSTVLVILLHCHDCAS